MISSWPTFHPDPDQLGDASLLASGAFAPATGLQAPGNESTKADDTVADALNLLVPNEVAAAAREAGGLVLVDAEGAPVVSVASPTSVTASPTHQWLAGDVDGAEAPVSGPFRRLHLPPPGPSSEPLPGAIIDRPLLLEDVRRAKTIAADAGGFTFLVRLVEPRVPSDVLLKSALVAAAHVPGATVVAVPFAAREDPTLQAALAGRLAHNYAVELTDVASDAHAWDHVRRLLDADDPGIDAVVDPKTLAILRQWRPERRERGLTVFFTGLSGSGKSTVARGVIDRLLETPRTVTSVDGDVARRMLSAGLTFSRADRDLNIRRIGWVASEVTRHGGLAVCAPIAPFASTRADVRSMVEANGDFVLVHISTPLAECERRDRKGLYAKARRGEIPDFTGISSPYEEPTDADLVIDTTDISVSEAVSLVMDHLVAGGWVQDAESRT